MYQSWRPKFRWIKPEIPLKPMGKSWCFFGRIPILWRIWTWKFTPNFKTNKPTKNKRFWGFKKNLIRYQTWKVWSVVFGHNFGHVDVAGGPAFLNHGPPNRPMVTVSCPFRKTVASKSPPGCPNCQAVQTSRKVPGTCFFRPHFGGRDFWSWNVLVGGLSLKSSFSPQHGFLGNFFSRKDSKKPEFFRGFWRRKIPEKITFQGCSPTGGKFGRFF